MTTSTEEGLRLTEEEAFSLLAMALTSPNRLDAISERALRKLARYCTRQGNHKDGHQSRDSIKQIHLNVS